MKTLLFTLEYPPFKGGVANYYGNLVKHYPKQDDIFVLHNNDNKLINNYIYPKWLPACWQLYKKIKKDNIKHILAGHILPLGTVTYLAAKFTKTKYSIILHGMDFSYALRGARKRWLVKKILNNAEFIICGNSYTADLVKKFLENKYKNKVNIINPGINIRVTRNGKRVTLLREKYNLQNKIVLFSIGRLVERKGFDKVIEAMPEVLKKIPNLIYMIAGAGPDEEYFKKKSKNIDNIIFLGKISDNEKWAFMDLCDIFIMPSRNIAGDFEGFGIVYLEANLSGKPVIAGDSGGVRDVVKNGINGLLVDPESMNSISNAITRLSNNKELRQKLGKQGRDRVISQFLWKKQARKIYKLLNFNKISKL